MSGHQPDSGRDLDVVVHYFGDDGRIPNNPHLPVLIYPSAFNFSGSVAAHDCIERFAEHGWFGAWQNGIYPFPHYHSTAHEVLGVCEGRVSVRLGGETGLDVDLKAGDALVLPAGTGHQNLGSSPDLLVVGAYPDGVDWDLCRGQTDERASAIARIEALSLPKSDPILGRDGPLLRHWRRMSEDLSR